MSPRTEEQFEAVREKKRAFILDAALKLFAKKGYYQTSMKDIANEAGISYGLIYNYFDSKETLISETIFMFSNNLIGLLDPNKDGTLTPDELRNFFEQMQVIIENNLEFWKLYLSMFTHLPVIDVLDKRFKELLEAYTVMFEKYFRSRGYKDPKTEAHLFGGFLQGIGFNFVFHPKIYSFKKMKDKLIEMYC